MKIENITHEKYQDIYVSDIYAYTFFSKKLIKYHGNAFFRDTISVCGFRYQVGKDPNIFGRFNTIAANNKTKSFSICSKPGVIFNNTVWFENEDDAKAKELFMNYNKDQIKKLEDKITQYKLTISQIDGMEIINGNGKDGKE